MTRRQIDFVIIGAGKAGTTSLFEYLRRHPKVYMPVAKELCFFSDEEKWNKGADWYLGWFDDADPEATVGEASPQYMLDDETPARMASLFPDVRIIATLRNPIDRAYSHYRHSRRLGLTTESFDDCARNIDGVTGFRQLLRYGEYGRILGAYLDHFPRSNVEVVRFEDLKSDAVGVVNEVSAWLGLPPMAEQAPTERAFNAGAPVRFPRLGNLAEGAIRWAYARPWIRRTSERVFGRGRMTAVVWWFRNELNVARGVRDAGPSAEARAHIAEFYARDVAMLEERLGMAFAWPDFA
jgi:hypothetical protein